jgi:hypothetical protein
MRADVFCRVIDNFGDIGVTWRLVRQLHSEYDWIVRLWVDNLSCFQRLEPGLQLCDQQQFDGIEIIHWTADTGLTPSPIAISMFSCDLPERYLAALHQHPALWINLEYLSAEDWVESCHALPSLRADGLASHFFFPGFTDHTGGLIRETHLIERRDAWQADREIQQRFLQDLGVSESSIRIWNLNKDGAISNSSISNPARSHSLHPHSSPSHSSPSHSSPSHSSPSQVTLSHVMPSHAALISLFCYPDINYLALISAFQHSDQARVLLVPEGICPALNAGHYGNLHVERIPFLPQSEYDKVLWTADLNFVRGEDSVVRAIWAGKPLVWQIYPQTEDTHLIKLQAWLARATLPSTAQTLVRRWNQTSLIENPAADGSLASALRDSVTVTAFTAWQQRAADFCHAQASRHDLARSLHLFCVTHLPQP